MITTTTRTVLVGVEIRPHVDNAKEPNREERRPLRGRRSQSFRESYGLSVDRSPLKNGSAGSDTISHFLGFERSHLVRAVASWL
jgi:hypothetical protein